MPGVHSAVGNQIVRSLLTAGAIGLPYKLNASLSGVDMSTKYKPGDEGAAFTVDVLGQTVVSEPEADAYAGRYLDLMERLARSGSEHGQAWRCRRKARLRTSASNPASMSVSLRRWRRPWASSPEKPGVRPALNPW